MTHKPHAEISYYYKPESGLSSQFSAHVRGYRSLTAALNDLAVQTVEIVEQLPYAADLPPEPSDEEAWGLITHRFVKDPEHPEHLISVDRGLELTFSQNVQDLTVVRTERGETIVERLKLKAVDPVAGSRLPIDTPIDFASHFPRDLSL